MNTNKHIPTGIKALDAVTGGLEIGKLTFVASRPSQGKTTLAANLINHISVEKNLPVALFSLEMARHNFFERILAIRTRTLINVLKTGWLFRRQWANTSNEIEILSKAPLFIDDQPALPSSEILKRTLRLSKELQKKKMPLKVLIIDYLQLMKDCTPQNINRILDNFRTLAQELSLSIIVLAQCKRGPKGTLPNLSDLRPATIQTAPNDLVIFIQKSQQRNMLNIQLNKALSTSEPFSVSFDSKCGIIKDTEDIL